MRHRRRRMPLAEVEPMRPSFTLTSGIRGPWRSITLCVLLGAACGGAGGAREDRGAEAGAEETTDATASTGPERADGTADSRSVMAPVRCVAPAGDQPVEVSIIPAWKAGDRRSYTVVSTIGGGEQKRRVERHVDVEVLEADATGARLRWSGDAGVAGIMQGGDVLSDLIDRPGWDRIEVTYRTDGAGTFLEFDDPARFEQAVTGLVHLAYGALFDPEQLEQFSVQKSRDITVESVRNLLRMNLDVFHSPYGFVLRPGEAVSGPVEVPGFGAVPFPATATTRLVSTADPDGCTVVETTTALEPGPLEEALQAQYRDPADPERTIDELQPISEATTVDVSSYDPATGWIAKAERTTTIHGPAVNLDHHVAITSGR